MSKLYLVAPGPRLVWMAWEVRCRSFVLALSCPLAALHVLQQLLLFSVAVSTTKRLDSHAQ